MRNIFTKDVTGIVILVVVMVVAGLLLSSQSGSGDRTVALESGINPSIYNDRASGGRGFFEWTAKLGRRTDVSRTDWSTLPQDAAILVSMGPRVSTASTIVAIVGGSTTSVDKSSLSMADAENVETWVRAGHTLLLMTTNLPGPTSGAPTGGSDFGQTLGVDVSSAIGTPTPKSPLTTVVAGPTLPLALMDGVNTVRYHPGARVLRSVDDEVALFGKPPRVSGHGPLKGESAAILFGLGKGHVIVIADSEFASNANLPHADNAIFLANIIDAYSRPGDRVLFDEYHHGDVAEAGSGVWQAMGRPIQLGLIQAGLAFVVLLIVLAPRFGAPLQVTSRARRTSAEYVTSLAGLYRNARATVPALEIVYKQFLRDVCSRLALPPDVSLEQLSDAAARRAHVNKVNLRRLLGNCERALDQQSLTESELLELVQQMERFRKDLGID